MPRAVAVPTRQEIVRRHQRGQTLGRIALELGLPYDTVRAIWRRYRDGGQPALAPRYARRGRPAGPDARRLARAACWLKRRHPTWGAGLIRLLRRRRWPDRAAPSARTLQRAFRAAGLSRPPRRTPPGDRRRAAAPHEVWQMDAVDGPAWPTAPRPAG